MLSKENNIEPDIIEDLLTINQMSRPGIVLDGVSKIVIHYTENQKSSAKANRDYFESLKEQDEVYASSQYIVGLDGEIIRAVPENELAYHSGNRVMNLNSIGIENTHEDETGKFNNATYNSLVELLAYLVVKYGLNPYNDIIRHYDVTGKLCPKYYVENEEEFQKLKEDVNKVIVSRSIMESI